MSAMWRELSNGALGSVSGPLRRWARHASSGRRWRMTCFSPVGLHETHERVYSTARQEKRNAFVLKVASNFFNVEKLLCCHDLKPHVIIEGFADTAFGLTEVDGGGGGGEEKTSSMLTVSKEACDNRRLR